MRELEVTEDPPQKNMAIMGIPIATMPPVPVPKRACANCPHRSGVGHPQYVLASAQNGKGHSKEHSFNRMSLSMSIQLLIAANH